MAKKYPKLGGILKKLLFDKNMKAVELARKVNLPPPTIHRLITGKSTRPYKSSLQPIADYFSVNIEQLLGEERLPDDLNTELEVGKDLSSSKIHYIPLIPWELLKTDKADADNEYEKLPFTGKISRRGFATIMQDSSMEPLFASGTLLFFEPDKSANDRSYVLVQLYENNFFVFRQLLVDVDQKYLKPLNPDFNAFKMRSLHSKDIIVAVLVEARHVY